MYDDLARRPLGDWMGGGGGGGAGKCQLVWQGFASFVISHGRLGLETDVSCKMCCTEHLL